MHASYSFFGSPGCHFQFIVGVIFVVFQACMVHIEECFAPLSPPARRVPQVKNAFLALGIREKSIMDATQYEEDSTAWIEAGTNIMYSAVAMRQSQDGGSLAWLKPVGFL